MAEALGEGVIADADGPWMALRVRSPDLEDGLSAVVAVRDEGVVDDVRYLESLEVLEHFLEVDARLLGEEVD